MLGLNAANLYDIEVPVEFQLPAEAEAEAGAPGVLGVTGEDERAGAKV